MRVHYYPGCTLKEKATNLEDSTREAMARLDTDLVEPEGWTCCGAEYPLITEKIHGLIPPVRILRQVEIEEGSKVVTTCAFCFAVLKRANKAMLDNPTLHTRVNEYLADDILIDPTTKEKRTHFESYNGDVQVLHLLEYLRDEVGLGHLKSLVKRDLSHIKVAPYYGCRLLRPQKEVAIDDPETPTIFEDFLNAIGCTVVDFPFKQECCGSYLSASMPETSNEPSYRVLNSAKMNGANVVALSCPLCYYNMDTRQDRIKEEYLEFNGFPVLYFTQLLAWALGADVETLGLDKHLCDPRPLFDIKQNAEDVEVNL
ncbi:CoB--CoM heterodisulfide reductase iron-sulfur subunit B family protein [bacterium]|nr:CoB--CoM heterodisulfide reductase iron-sulfur subunit B family protein [bacterium]